MAAPTAPTQDSMVVEAFSKHSITPTSAQKTQAKDEWMQEIKNDIWLKTSKNGKALKFNFLQSHSVLIPTIGKSRYALPSDYSSGLSMGIRDGNARGTAQAGSSSSITLAAAETIGESTAIGKEIFIISGTGIGSVSQCTAYDESTKVAAVEPDFDTAPNNTSGYMVAEEYYPLTKQSIRDYDKVLNPTDKYLPWTWHQIGDDDSGEFILKPCPDKVYALQLRYYVDLMFVDLAGTLMTTIYKRARNVFVYGVYAKLLEKLKNPDRNNAHAKYYDMLMDFIEKEIVDASPDESMIIKSAY